MSGRQKQTVNTRSAGAWTAQTLKCTNYSTLHMAVLVTAAIPPHNSTVFWKTMIEICRKLFYFWSENVISYKNWEEKKYKSVCYILSCQIASTAKLFALKPDIPGPNRL